MAKVPTLPVEGISISTKSVDSQLQAFISDIVYRIFYTPTSEIRTLVAGTGGLSPSSVIDIITDTFENAKEKILPYYSNLYGANIRIDDYYIDTNTLKIDSTITADTTTRQIFEEATINIRL